MPRVIHFDIHADDPQRAMCLYTELQSIAGVGYSAGFIDTEGNILGMFEDTSAAT